MSSLSLVPRRSLPVLALVVGSFTLAVVAPAATFADDDHRRDRGRGRYEDRDRRNHDRRDHDRGRYDRRDRNDDRYDRGRYQRDNWRDRYRDERGYRGRATFQIPRHVHDRRAYERYYHGRVYHPGHRHHHAVYGFPVYSHGGVVYEPYAYCGDAYFARGAFYDHGPSLSIRWHF